MKAWKQLLSVLSLHSQFLCLDQNGQVVGIQVPDSFVDRRSMKLKLGAMNFLRTVQHKPTVELYETHSLNVRVTYLEGYVTFELV